MLLHPNRAQILMSRIDIGFGSEFGSGLAVANPVDSKIDKVKRHATEMVAVLTIDERTRNRRKINRAAADANEAIEQVIEKAARAAKEFCRK